MEVYDQQWALGRPFTGLVTVKTEHGEYISGAYHFKHGSIIIHSQSIGKRGYHASFTYYLNDRGYYRTLERKQPFSFRSLAIFAGKFAKSFNG